MPTNYEKVKAWRKLNPEKVTAQAQRRRQRNPEPERAAKRRYRERHLDEIRAKDREAQSKRRADPEGSRRRVAAFKARREAERVSLAGRPRPTACELCGENGKTVFDHCHQQGHFRGWICDRCNRVLGSVRDDIGLLGKMIAYLEQSNGRTHHEETEGSPVEQVRVPKGATVSH